MIFMGAGCTQKVVETPIEQPETLPEPIALGIVAPFTGEKANSGSEVRKGVELAIEDLGLRATVVAEDSKCEGASAVAAMTKLITVDQVQAVIGDTCANASLAAAPIAEEAGIVMISPATTVSAYSDAGNYIFRTVPSDAAQGTFGAQLVYNRGFRKMAVLYVNNEYGKAYESALTADFSALGGSMIGSEAYDAQEKTFTKLLTNLTANNPDVLYIVSDSTDSAVLILKQAKEAKVRASIIGSDIFKNDLVVKAAGLDADGILVVSLNRGNESFVSRYTEKYQEAPGLFAAQAYDAVRAISEAMNIDIPLKDALYQISFDGVSGAIDFNEKGDMVTGNYEVYVVGDGALIRQ